MYLIAETLNTGCSIRQNILRINGEACVIQIHATASLASICNWGKNTLQSVHLKIE